MIREELARPERDADRPAAAAGAGRPRAPVTGRTLSLDELAEQSGVHAGAGARARGLLAAHAARRPLPGRGRPDRGGGRGVRELRRRRPRTCARSTRPSSARRGCSSSCSRRRCAPAQPRAAGAGLEEAETLAALCAELTELILLRDLRRIGEHVEHDLTAYPTDRSKAATLPMAETIDLASRIRDIPDFPKPGIVFKDVMPLLADAEALHEAVDELAEWAEPRRPDVILGAEARGFVLGAALAYKLGCGFVAARKPGKLPYETVSAQYALEYGVDSLELHVDAVTRRHPRTGARRPAGHRRHGAGQVRARRAARRRGRRRGVPDRARLPARARAPRRYDVHALIRYDSE